MENARAHRKIARRRPPRFELVGELPCLDFVNTLDNRWSEPKELLKDYVDLARFAEDTGMLAPHQVDRLIERSALAQDAARRALRDAVELRESLYAVLAAVMRKQAAPATALAKLNAFVQDAAQHMRLVESGGRLEWRLDDPFSGTSGSSLDAPLWAIARSAADLLASEQLAYVRACSSKTCQWLFLDTSKNHRRRWCDMKLCGNRSKVQRFYTRKKKMVE